MRPNKPINTGAHRSGTSGRGAKGRYFANSRPTPVDRVPEVAGEIEPDTVRTDPGSKYEGRDSVVRQPDEAVEATATGDDAAAEQWVDPLDADRFDLTHVTIDLRETMIDQPPDSYYQRHSSQVPGRK